MFNTKFPIYAFTILIALISNIIVVLFTSKKSKFTKKEILCMLIYENIGIVIGAKIFTFLLNPEKGFNFNKLGLSSYGALFGSILFLLLFSFQFKKSIKKIITIFAPSFPLMYSIGKVGCFIVGCCYGIKYNGFGKVVYHYSKIAPNGVTLFPIQLVESVLFLLIFIYMLNCYVKKKRNEKTILNAVIMCSSAKFIFDFFRMSHVYVLISINQIISVCFIIISLFLKTKIHFSLNKKI